MLLFLFLLLEEIFGFGWIWVPADMTLRRLLLSLQLLSLKPLYLGRGLSDGILNL